MTKTSKRGLTLQQWYHLLGLFVLGVAALGIILKTWAEGDRPIRAYVVGVVRDSLPCCKEPAK